MNEFNKFKYEKHLGELISKMQNSFYHLKDKNMFLSSSNDLRFMKNLKDINGEINIYLDELIFHERKYLENNCEHEWEKDLENNFEYNRKICKKCESFK